MTRIFLIRHAEAEGNLFRCAQGQYEGLITPRGFAQIKALKKRFEDKQIDCVYSSDMIRTQVTSTAITDSRNIPLTITTELREVCMGNWEGVAWGDIEYLYPEMCKNFGLDPANWQNEGSESYENVIKRVTGFINKAAQEHDGQTIALFTHGFAIRSFLCRLMGYASNESIKLPYCDNTAVALLTYDNGDFTIEYQGDNSHLSEDESTFASQKWWRDESLSYLETENMRYEPLDASRHLMLLDKYHAEMGDKPEAELELAAFFAVKPAGLVGFNIIDDSMGELEYIFLLPDFRGARFSIQLLGKVITELRKRKISNLRVKVPKDNPLAFLCKKHGFEIKAEIKERLVLEKNIRNW